MNKRFVIRPRVEYQGRPVKSEVLALAGQEFEFTFGWTMCDSDQYPGEVAWIAPYWGYPKDAPVWIASGDLKEVPWDS